MAFDFTICSLSLWAGPGEVAKHARLEALSTSEMESARAEIGRGFSGSMDVDRFSDEARLSLPAGAFSGGPSPMKTGREILVDKVQEVGGNFVRAHPGTAPCDEKSPDPPLL